MKADVRHNCGNSLEQTRLLPAHLQQRSSRVNFGTPGSEVPARAAFLLPTILDNKTVTFF